MEEWVAEHETDGTGKKRDTATIESQELKKEGLIPTYESPL